MIADWNWFFSSIAQSSAAIVGIFGAFIFTKIINNQREFNTQKATINSLQEKSQKLKDDASLRYWGWVVSHSSIENEFITTISRYRDQPSERIIDLLTIPNFITRERLINIINSIKQTENSHYQLVLLRQNLPEFYNSEKRPIDTNQFDREFNLTQELYNTIKEHIRNIEYFTNNIEKNPLSSSTITISIILSLLLFLSGVLIPLYLIPIESTICIYNYTKYIILITTSSIFIGTLIWFLMINIQRIQ